MKSRKAATVLVAASLSAMLLTGCDKLGFKGDQQEQVDYVMRLAQAPEASEAFLARYSAIECEAKTKNICTAKGCEEAPVSVTQRYDIRKRIYQRHGANRTDQAQRPDRATHSDAIAAST